MCPTGFPVGTVVKNPPVNAGDAGWETATHSSVLAWRIPRTEELVGYNPWGHEESSMTEHTHTHTHTHTHDLYVFEIA